MRWQEEFLQTLVENEKYATPEEKERGIRIANNFVYSRLSTIEKKRIREWEKQTLLGGNNNGY